MKPAKFFFIALEIAILAALVNVIDTLLQSGGNSEFFLSNSGFGWITFQAWAVYFFGGCDLKGGVNAFVAFVLGIVASILIMVLGGWFVQIGVPGFWAIPLSLVVLVIPVIYLEYAKVMIPALFIGSGMFFGIMTWQPAGENTTFLNAACTELIYCVLGLAMGWISATVRMVYEKRIAKKS